MIRAIVYDAVGTLIHVRPSVAGIYANIGQRFGSQLPIDEIYRRFPLAFARQELLDQQAGWRTSEARERDRWRQIVAEVLDDVADPECFATLFNTFAKPAAWTLDPNASEVFADLHERGFRQAVASNFDQRLRGILDAMPISRYVEATFVSSEIGWRKPAPEFFAHITKAMRLSPGEILVVGDDRANDYEAALKAGMRAALVAENGLAECLRLALAGTCER